MSTYTNMAILSIEDGQVTLGFRQRFCRRVLLTDLGVLTCQRTQRHRGPCAALDADGRLIVADVIAS